MQLAVKRGPSRSRSPATLPLNGSSAPLIRKKIRTPSPVPAPPAARPRSHHFESTARLLHEHAARLRDGGRLIAAY